MPLTLPSHPGLILPLWIRRPARWDAVALSTGAMIPDAVDLPLMYLTGDRDFKLAHTLAGLLLVGIPLGFALSAAVDPLCRTLLAAAARRAGRVAAAGGATSPTLSPRLGWLSRLLARPFRWRRVLASVAAGGFSHLVFDALSHQQLEWFRPWARPKLPSFFPGHFERAVLRVPVPGLVQPWGIWPFDLVWLLLTLIGAVLFLWACRKGLDRPTWR